MAARACRRCRQPGHYAKTCGEPRRRKRYLAGPCSRKCGRPRDSARYGYCKVCRRAVQRRHEQDRYLTARMRGRCTRCRHRRAMKNASTCWGCLQKLRTYRRKYNGSEPKRPGGPGRPLLTFEDV